MLEIMAVLVVVGLIIFNVYGDKIKTAMNTASSPAAPTTQAEKIAQLHKDVDAWLELRGLPSVKNDPQAVQAMEFVKNALLKYENIVGE